MIKKNIYIKNVLVHLLAAAALIKEYFHEIAEKVDHIFYVQTVTIESEEALSSLSISCMPMTNTFQLIC